MDIWKSESVVTKLDRLLDEDGTFRKWDGIDFRKIIGRITKNYILVSDFYVGANWLKDALDKKNLPLWKFCPVFTEYISQFLG